MQSSFSLWLQKQHVLKSQALRSCFISGKKFPTEAHGRDRVSAQQQSGALCHSTSLNATKLSLGGRDAVKLSCSAAECLSSETLSKNGGVENGGCHVKSESQISQKRKRKRRTVPDLSSDEWSVLCTVHVGVEGHLEVLWRQNIRWVKGGDKLSTQKQTKEEEMSSAYLDRLQSTVNAHKSNCQATRPTV